METVPDTGRVRRKTMGDALRIPPGEREREGRDSGEKRGETEIHVHRNPIGTVKSVLGRILFWVSLTVI